MAKRSVSLFISLLAQMALAHEGVGRSYHEIPFACPEPKEQIVVVVRKQADPRYHGPKYICGVALPTYSWWDTIPGHTGATDVWFPCHHYGLEPGDSVKGTVAYSHNISCERCNPGRLHNCTPAFEPEFP